MRPPSAMSRRRARSGSASRARGDDPQERDGGHVGGEERGDAQQVAGRDERQRHPAEPAASADTLGPAPGGAPRRRPDARGAEPAGGEDPDERHVAGRPPAMLGLQRDVRLDQQRVAQQRGQASQIAAGIEKVRVTAVRGAGEPVLHDRRWPTARRTAAPRRARAGAGARRSAARPPGTIPRVRTSTERQRHERERGQGEVRGDLPPALQPGRQHVGVAIADQQRRLEEDQARVPDGGDTAQHGDEQLADHGLDHEEQAGAEEGRDREQRSRQVSTTRRRVLHPRASDPSVRIPRDDDPRATRRPARLRR